MSRIENEDAARRLAHAIASDIALYNGEKIRAAAAAGDPLGEIEDELAEGRALFESRVSPELTRLGLLEEAIQQVVVRPTQSGDAAPGQVHGVRDADRAGGDDGDALGGQEDPWRWQPAALALVLLAASGAYLARILFFP